MKTLGVAKAPRTYSALPRIRLRWGVVLKSNKAHCENRDASPTEAARKLITTHALTKLLILLSFAFLSVGAFAQYMPVAPLFPKSAQECQSYSEDVEAFRASVGEQHEQCLSTHDHDRPNEPPSSVVCSSSSCQYLHDRLFGNNMWSAKSLQADVAKCYEEVKEAESKQIQRQTAERAEQAARDARDAKERQDAADREARRQTDRDAQAVLDASHGKRDRDEARKSAEAQEADALAAQRYLDSAAAAARLTEPHPKPQAPDATLRSTQPAGLADPFAEPSAKLIAEHLPTNASMVDPFPSKDSLLDPFNYAAPRDAALKEPSERERTLFELAAGTLEESAEASKSVLQKDIEYVRSQAGKTYSVAKANALVVEIQDTESLINTVSHFVKAGQYAVLLKNSSTAESRGRKEEAGGDIIQQIVKDALPRDLLKKGLTEVAPRLFGERVGIFLVNAAVPGVNAGAILLDSEKTGRGPTEIIHDTTGKVSLAEKQAALTDMWKGYERRQSQTGGATGDGLKQELWTNSNIVYNECLEAKVKCDGWKQLLDRK
jgi:hypothetical protein